MEELLEVLKKVSFFSNLDDHQLMALCDGLDLLTYHSGEVVFKQGSVGDALYIIISGAVKVHQGNHEFANLGSGDYFGEYSMFDRQERSATVTATERTQLIGISSERFFKWIKEDTSYVEAILKDLVSRHRMLDTIQEELAASKTDLIQTKDELDALISGARDPIVMIDEKGKIILANKAAQIVLENDDVVGRNFMLFLSEESKDRFEKQLQEKGFTKGVLKHWVELIGSDGTVTRHEGTFSRIDHKNQQRYVLIFRNIEDRLAAEETIDQLTSETQYLKEELDQLSASNGIIARSPAMLHVLDQIEHVAATSATVLITGETGTGKELVARAIHDSSQRKEAPMIRINCGAIPENLIESELFGHVKGAFTGASQDRKGRFLLANGGTLFLDEIGELPIALQPKLLRVIQEGEFEPVGSNETVKVNVRILAATHRDLMERSKKGAFREDLYYRLNVFPIHVPALRDRGDDVIDITEFMLSKFVSKFNKPTIALSEADKIRLRDYNWKGNVRELQNVIERAVILSQKGRVSWELVIPKGTDTSQEKIAQEHRIYSQKELLHMERENLMRALKKCRWKVSGPNGAAELLGIAPTTLQSKLKALGIERPV